MIDMILATLLASAAAPRLAPPDVVVTAQTGFPAAARTVPDAELATMRGGLLLPNGLDIALAIDIQTRVDGVLQLHTVYSSAGDEPGIRIFRDDKVAPEAPPAVTPAAAPATPGIVVDRSPTGTTVTTAPVVPAATIRVSEAPASTWPPVSGEIAVPVTPNGGPVQQESGRYTLTSDADGTVARFDTDTLSIQHLVGHATAAIVLNTASDRVIDTTSALSIDLGNLPVAEVTGALAMDAVAYSTVWGR